MVAVVAMSALIFAGLLALALAMRRHSAQVFGPGPPGTRPVLLRLLGWTLLTAATGVAAASGDVAIAAMVCLGVLTVAAGSIALGLAWLAK